METNYLEDFRLRQRPLYIFDLDGTLFDPSHRVDLLTNKEDPDRWVKFYSAGVLDAPISATVETLKLLAHAGCEIRFWSGRADFTFDDTVNALREVLPLSVSYLTSPGVIRLRNYAPIDKRNDSDMKEEWLNELPAEDRSRLVAIFEDRQRVVDMWRKNGVTCYQVAPGDF